MYLFWHNILKYHRFLHSCWFRNFDLYSASLLAMNMAKSLINVYINLFRFTNHSSKTFWTGLFTPSDSKIFTYGISILKSTTAVRQTVLFSLLTSSNMAYKGSLYSRSSVLNLRLSGYGRTCVLSFLCVTYFFVWSFLSYLETCFFVRYFRIYPKLYAFISYVFKTM